MFIHKWLESDKWKFGRPRGVFLVEYIHDLTGARSTIQSDSVIDLAMIRTVIEAAVPKEHKLIKLEETCAERLTAVYRIESRGNLAKTYQKPTRLMSCEVWGEADVAKATYNREKFSIEMLRTYTFQPYVMRRMPTVIYKE